MPGWYGAVRAPPHRGAPDPTRPPGVHRRRWPTLSLGEAPFPPPPTGHPPPAPGASAARRDRRRTVEEFFVGHPHPARPTRPSRRTHRDRPTRPSRRTPPSRRTRAARRHRRRPVSTPLPALAALAQAAGPPGAAEVFTRWRLDPPSAAVLLLAAGLYAWGMIRVQRRHPAQPWPWARAAAFFGALAVIAAALMSIVAVYETTFFWVHMIQHLMLIMVAPVLLVTGRPLILALHASRNPVHRAVKRALRSRPVTVLTSPLVAVPLYAAVVVGTHLTSFNNLAVTNHAALLAEQVAYLAAGYLYFLPGFGDEPIRWHLSYPAKMLIILLVMPIDTFTGIALLMTTQAPWPAYAAQAHTWGPDPLTDVHWGGAVMWVGGDTIMIALVVAALLPWLLGRGRSGGRLRWIEQARRATMDRYRVANAGDGEPERRADVDEDQARLDAYNAWLAQMSARDADRR
jgi:cytochrome c oxidase assembly factor CtaG